MARTRREHAVPSRSRLHPGGLPRLPASGSRSVGAFFPGSRAAGVLPVRRVFPTSAVIPITRNTPVPQFGPLRAETKSHNGVMRDPSSGNTLKSEKRPPAPTLTFCMVYDFFFPVSNGLNLQMTILYSATCRLLASVPPPFPPCGRRRYTPTICRPQHGSAFFFG